MSHFLSSHGLSGGSVAAGGGLHTAAAATSQNGDSRRKMTCRSPSSASSRSNTSSSSGVSSSHSSTDAAACVTAWQQTVTIREIYKTGKLGLLVDKKSIFWRHEQRKEPFWCVFCIHNEAVPFLELYEDHKASLTHKPLRVITLSECQHVSPNISLVEDKHSFTLTLAREIYQFTTANQADMQDWILTLRTRLQDLQGSEAAQNTYTRCPLPAKSDRLLSPEPLFVELPPSQSPVPSDPPPMITRPKTPIPTPIPIIRPKELVFCQRIPDRRPSPLPPPPATLSTTTQSLTALPTPLASPPACEAPPIPSTTPPPPVPPRGTRSMRPVPHPLITAHIPPPPPPRAGDTPDLGAATTTTKPPRPPRKDDVKLLPVVDEGVPEQAPLICLGDEVPPPLPQPPRAATVKAGSSEYGTLFPREKPPQLPKVAARPPAAMTVDHKRATRSQTVSPALSERSVTSSVSEPSGESSSSTVTPATCPAATAAVCSALTACLPRLVAAAAGNTPSHTLRQQQVDRLKQEMCEPSGVKVRVRRKDCQTALALVDCFGCIWVAGWKQKEHPHFHSLFHLGDQILSVNGIYISRAADVFRILKDCQEKQHAVFCVNRVPRGQVFVLARQFDGQDLGLLREGHTAEVKSVLSDGLAAEHGLPAKAITCDGNTLCRWVITEINHRPLNWFFKDNEIDDRLKAVGKEISILVQPSDLVNAIKKQLRSLRNYKDFIVQ